MLLSRAGQAHTRWSSHSPTFLFFGDMVRMDHLVGGPIVASYRGYAICLPDIASCTSRRNFLALAIDHSVTPCRLGLDEVVNLV